MEMRHVKTFCAVVKYGGFSKAARELDYAQSTVTTHIKALENDLQSPLFDRLGKKVLLTKSGHHFHPYALELLAIYEKAQEIPKDSNHPEGTLTITANESLAVYRLPNILQKYKLINPKVNIVLETGTNEQAIKKLRDGETDIIFLIGQSMEYDELITTPLFDETLGWVLPPDLASCDNPLKILKDYQFIYTERNCGYRAMVDNYIRMSGQMPDRTFESSSIEVIKQSVLCGLGLAILPYIVVKENCNNNELIFKPIEAPQFIKSNVIYHKSRWISPVLQSFLSILEK
ncbi:LysR family transcriptional regulator [Cytobacillus sp. Sa5YUA1]|uniref:LysR family transcriptional regulator n=1 Tax=Cytobacillus stercorigallinarum TaxID=2762240 RepID=A0ABR8QLJ6_9BACI|nr:LysR family transcriptional regulator [Cytobacillus stercorigallinarum]MBD7936400.1 LysR family transcriptional regulator [Cytobacillus stercorigallinarum]